MNAQMATQQQLVLEDLAAALTHLGLLIGVNELGLGRAAFPGFLGPRPVRPASMLQEHATAPKSLRAATTLEPHPAMHHLVLEEVGPATEGPTTFAALVRLLAAVHSLVLAKP